VSDARPLLEAALRETLGDPGLRVSRLLPVSGGCISHAARGETSAGDVFFKWNADCPDDLFLSEAAGLQELAAAGSGLAIPRVLAAFGPSASRPALIALEWLEPAAGEPGHDEALGRGLAHLHRRSAPRFGFETRTYCGTTPQDNAWSESWPAFYAERRIEPLLRAVENRRGLGSEERRTYQRVLERLPDRLGHGSGPSLVHGDLWAGNVLATARGPALVDPACAYADRELEFGISTLFGGVSARALAAYEEVRPLDPGWRERNGLYQLYHLLNHALLFGGHYGSAARDTARRYV
jgi:fructosamine-3-kinase